MKFDSVNEIIGTQAEVPASVESLMSREKQSVEIDNDYAQVKDILLSKI